MEKGVIKLTNGLVENEDYKAFKFHGGEIHFKFKDEEKYLNLLKTDKILIKTRIHNSDELMLLILVVDMLRKDGYDGLINVYLPYLPYMQADRDFSAGETFSLKTLSRLLKSIEVDNWMVFDAHSDVTHMVVNNITILNPNEIIKDIISDINSENLAIMSPDNGGYKRVKKIVNGIKWEGDFFTANKDRNISSGNIDEISFNTQDFEGKDILIIDDICIGGRTFIELAKKLKECNVGKLYLYVSHGLFTHGISPLTEYYETIYTTNSREEHQKFIDEIDEGKLKINDVL